MIERCTFRVTVARTATRYTEVDVVVEGAYSHAAAAMSARRQALAQAGDIEFPTEKDAEYKVEHTEKIKTT